MTDRCVELGSNNENVTRVSFPRMGRTCPDHRSICIAIKTLGVAMAPLEQCMESNLFIINRHCVHT